MRVYLAAGLLAFMTAALYFISLWGLGRRKHRYAVWYGGAWFYLLRKEIMSHLHMQEQEMTSYQKLYRNEQPEEQYLKNACWQGICLLAIAGFLSAALAWGQHAGLFSEKPVTALIRPAAGTGITQLKVWYRDQDYELSIPVSEMHMTPEEAANAIEEAKGKLKTWILGDNPSTEQVSEDLNLIRQLPDTSISVNWLTSSYRLIDYEGHVFSEQAEQGGSEVVLIAVCTYRGLEERIEIPVRVVAGTSQTEQTAQMLQQYLEEITELQEYEKKVSLPKQYEQDQLHFYQPRKYAPFTWGAIAGLFGVLVFVLWKSKMDAKHKERECQLLQDYPNLVSKMTLLLEAGLTIKSAWDRIARDYQQRRKKGGEKRYVYEEWLQTWNQLQVGTPEESAYGEFGRRCGNIRYLRFSSILVQNLKKGTDGILPLLQKEAIEAFCDRKERAKQLGEEAGTKLLLPMAGILVLILAMILIPAFMAF